MLNVRLTLGFAVIRRREMVRFVKAQHRHLLNPAITGKSSMHGIAREAGRTIKFPDIVRFFFLLRTVRVQDISEYVKFKKLVTKALRYIF